MDDQFETYYLVQRSNTGYVWVTYYSTRVIADARRKLDAVDENWDHHRILDARTQKVHRINRPERDL
jgi:hypothetical protein